MFGERKRNREREREDLMDGVWLVFTKQLACFYHPAARSCPHQAKQRLAVWLQLGQPSINCRCRANRCRKMEWVSQSHAEPI